MNLLSRSCFMNRFVCIDPAIRMTAEQLEPLLKRFQVVYGWDCTPEQTNNIEGILLHSKVTQEFVKKFSNLQWIGVRAKNTSYVPENIGNIRVFGIESLGATAVAEHTFALIFALSKQILQSAQNVREGHWREGLSLNVELKGKTIGIIGNGTIGKEVARIAQAFGMNVIVAKSPRDTGAGFSLQEVLEKSDIVSIHLSSRKENYHLFNEQTLRSMKKGALLINTSRGDVIDEIALEKVLNENHLGGAGLDVLETEPPSHLKLAKIPNVVVTPHKGFLTFETVAAMTDALVRETIKRTNSP